MESITTTTSSSSAMTTSTTTTTTKTIVKVFFNDAIRRLPVDDEARIASLDQLTQLLSEKLQVSPDSFTFSLSQGMCATLRKFKSHLNRRSNRICLTFIDIFLLASM
jgi:hypothetical protein